MPGPKGMTCPLCEGKGTLKNPDWMDPAELKLLRGQLGWRLGYGGPMEWVDLAKLLGVTTRALRRYVSGERAPNAAVVHRARELRDNPPARIPFALAKQREKRKRAKEQRVRYFERKGKADEALQQQLAEGEEPPF